MKKRLSVFLITLLVINYSCKDNTQKEEGLNQKVQDTIAETKNHEVKDLSCQDNDTLQYEDTKISIYNEYKLRGDGVVSISINDKLSILNEDNSLFGEIILKEESDYEINLPKKIVARSMVPVFDDFSFDADKPKDNDEFIHIYINKEPKRIRKTQVEFSFDNWEDYLKNSFIKLRNCNNEKDLNIYKVLNVMKDYIKVKSISKESCENIDNYTDVTKELKWKNNENVLMIDFFSCN